MSGDHPALRALACAQLDWTEDGTPRSTEFDDIYYSQSEGMAESEYTFILGNNLPERLSGHPHRVFCIGETGFGTGLNFLLAWRAWRGAGPTRPDLHVISVEKHPLTRADLARALDAWHTLDELAQQLLAQYPPALPGCHRLLFDDARVRLDLHLGDAREVLADLAAQRVQAVDAWFLDGFAPDRNAAMWSEQLFRPVAALSRSGATFATFTAAGSVRRALQASGFATRKVPGFGSKRESLRGSAADCRPHDSTDSTPWDLPRAPPQQAPQHALVLGGGLAGCWTAHALARRGIAVTLLEQGDIADAASGNAQGVLYTRLSHRHSPLVDFALLSYLLAGRAYAQLFADGALRPPLDGALCGALQLVADEAELAGVATALAGLETLAQVVAAREATRLAGVELQHGGYWYPGSGWLDPRAVCRALLDDGHISVMQHCGPVTLQPHGDAWRAVNGRGEPLATAPCAVIAAGTASSGAPQLSWLPLRAIRGQTTQLPADEPSRRLDTVLCHSGYLPPARDGAHCIGASFNLDCHEPLPRREDQRHNLDALAAALPAWRERLALLDEHALEGRVGFRCASPDYLPVAGPVPDYDAFLADYAPLRENARRVIDTPGTYLPGLFVNTAHGSRGLTSTPMTAQLLASIICAEPPPLPRSLRRAVAPARFIIRDLGRNRV